MTKLKFAMGVHEDVGFGAIWLATNEFEAYAESESMHPAICIRELEVREMSAPTLITKRGRPKKHARVEGRADAAAAADAAA